MPIILFRRSHWIYNAHGHKLRFPTFEKAQFVTALGIAHDRIEKKKSSLVAGMFGTLISRPNSADMQMVSVENRLEPYWMVTAASHTAYDRQQVYTVPIKGEDS